MASRPIDEKIVVMKLDNADFKRKAAETTGLFGSLRSSMDKIGGVKLDKTVKGVEKIGTQADLAQAGTGRLADSVNMISSRFSAMGIVATTALVNIANRAVNAGLAMANSLSFEQINAGFREYELKIGSIGTVLSNTEWAGTDLEDVNKTLGELNEYADQTIYNFAQMTQNIGRFTAAGVKLEDSAIAIKGLSNLAAASGSDVNQLNTAMYQMSQAMAAGRMNLMDWNSLVNAGMGGKKTQDALLATAKAMGVNVDMSEGFRNSISKGWLTSEIFLETLKQFGQDESMIEAATKVRTFTAMLDTLKEGIGSGWATTWELIFGDFEEATEFWTNMSNSIGGWFQKSTDARNELLKGVADGGGIQNIFSGLQNAVKPLIQIFNAAGEAFREVFPAPSVNQIVMLARRFKSFTHEMSLSGETIDKVKTIFTGVFASVDSSLILLKSLGKAFLNLIPEGTGTALLDFVVRLAEMSISFNQSMKDGNALTKTIDKLGNFLGEVGSKVSDTIGSVTEFGSSLRENIGKAADWVMEKLAPVGKFLSETFGGFGTEEVLGGATLVGGFLLFQKLFGMFDNASSVFDTLQDTISGIGEGINGVLENVGGALESFQQQVQYTNLLKIAIAVGILAVSLKLLEGIKTEDIVKGIVALGVSMGLLVGAMVMINKYNLVGGMTATTSMIALAIAVSIMASALKKLSDLDLKEMAVGLTGLVVITGALAGAVIAMSKWGGKIGTSSIQLLALAGAVYILADAVEKLSELNVKDLAKGVGALTLILGGLVAFLKVADSTKFGPASALGVVLIAGAIQLMVNAVDKMASMDTGELIKGLTGMAVILGQIVIFSKLLMNPATLASGAALVLIATSLNLMMGPLERMAEMTWGELIKGMLGMATALGIMAGAALLATTGMAGAASIALMAVALNLLIGPIERFAQMTWGELIKGFVGLAGGMTLLAFASALLTPAVPSMLAFGGALLVMGVALLAAGGGIALFGVGLAALAGMTATSIAAIIGALGLLIKGLGSLIEYVVDFVVELSVALIDGILLLAPKLADGAVQLVMALLDTITTYLPDFIDLGVLLIVQLIDGIGRSLKPLVNAGLDLIVSFIESLADGIRNNGPKITGAILELIGEILILVVEAGVQVINALFGWIPGVKEATSAIADTATDYIRDNFKAREVGEEKGGEFNDAIDASKPGARKAGRGLAKAGQEGAEELDLTTIGANFGSSFAGGMDGTISVIRTTARTLAGAAINAMKDRLDINSPSREAHLIGEQTGQGKADGIKAKTPEVEKVSTKMGEAAVNGIVKGVEKKKPVIADTLKKTITSTVTALTPDIERRFASSMSKAEQGFKDETLSAQAYIKELEKIKKAYSTVPSLVKKVEEEISQVKKGAGEYRAELLKKETDAQKKMMDELKYYNKLSITEELKMWEQMASKYKQNGEARKEIDREIYRVKNEINNKLKDINDQYLANVQETNRQAAESEQSLTDNYIDQVQQRTNAIANFMGIFAKVNNESEVTGQELVKNLSDQVAVMYEWTNDLEVLASKGLDLDFLDELRKMGPSEAANIKALTQLTSEELVAYSEIWKQRYKIASEQATYELEWLKDETIIAIEELRKETAKELEEYAKEWKDSIGEITKDTSDQFVDLSTSMKDIGINSVSGLIEGMKSMEGPLAEQAKLMADSILSTITKELDINSPSKETESLAMFAGSGLVNGLSKSLSKVKSEASRLAVTVKDTIGTVLDSMNFDKQVNVNLDFDANSIPDKDLMLRAIAPDLSFVNGLVYSTASALRSQNADKYPRKDKTPKPVRENGAVITQNLTFNSPQPSPSEVARKNLQASRQLAMEWGL